MPLQRPIHRFVLALIAAVAAIAPLAAPAPTFASCAIMADIRDAMTSADIIFVGTVTATANRDTWATVTVEDVWRGPDQPAQVLIKGGPAGNAATSVDRTFAVGEKYLFFPYADPAGGISDNSCSSTRVWSPDLAALRPADARAAQGVVAPVVENGFDVDGLLAPLAVGVLVAGALLGVGLLARGRQPA
jgi:hypothetical protein